MRNSSKMLLGAAAAAVVAGLVPSSARATDYVWTTTAGGALNWQDPANWGGVAFPNAATDTANLSVGLTSNLTVDVGATDVTTGALTLGGTAGAVTTNVTSTGGLLIFNNSAANASLVSGGVAGSTNIVSANIRGGGEVLEVSGANNLSVTGAVQQAGGTLSLRSLMPTGTKVTFSGPISTLDAVDGTTARTLTLNDNAANTGTLEVSGLISGSGQVAVGVNSNSNTLVLGTVILSNANTFGGIVTENRGNLVLANNQALGPGTGSSELRSGNPSTQFGFNIASGTGDDSLNIPTDFRVGQHATFTGNNSIEWSGAVYQGNGRSVINLLPAGKVLKLSGGVAANRDTDTGRNMIFDGTGRTLVTAGLFNVYNSSADVFNDVTTAVGNYTKQGTGVLRVGGTSNYAGTTTISGGLLMFETSAAYGAGAIIASGGGAVGMATGTTTDATFLGKIQAGAVGALALTTGESGATLDFTSGALAGVNGMSVGADEGGITFTGTINPANSKYRLGGGGQLTIPNANTMTGGNAVDIANGGVVVVSANQNYTGATSIIGEAVQSNTARALANNTSPATAVNAPTVLSVASVDNGGNASGLGASPAAASNLVINGGTLLYTGAAGGTDRLFTVDVRGATLDASGTGALALNTAGGANVTSGTGARTLTLTGSNTGNNSVGGTLANGTLGTDTLAVTKTGAGKWVLGGANTYTGGTTVSAGTLSASNGDAFAGGALTVADGATGMIEPGTTKAVTLTTLNTNTSGKFDITNNSAVIRSSSVAAVGASVKTGYAGGAWTGPGINSSTAAGGTTTGIGFADNAVLALTSFKGVSVGPTDVLVKYTYYGDADLDGDVDGNDVGRWATNFTGSGGSTAKTWVEGDWDYDGDVDGNDVGRWAVNFTGSGGGTLNIPSAQPEAVAMLQAMGFTVVPEPTGLVLLGVAGAGLLVRRRRRGHA
jgi:fibronectin-binding autotransporter adhesin